MSIKPISIVLASLFLFLTVLPLLWAANETNEVLFTTEIQADATPAVVAKIRSYPEKAFRKIKFQKGTYHFYPDKAFEAFAFISNHDNVLTRTPFPLHNISNLTIDGQGSTFIFHGVMIPFLITDSKNIRVENLSIDWATTFHSEGLIVAVDEKNKSFDLKISAEYPYEIRNEQLYFIKEYYEHTIGQSILYDPKRRAITFDTESYTPLTTNSRNAVTHGVEQIKYPYAKDFKNQKTLATGTENRLRVIQFEPGLVRIFNHIKKLPPVGNILVCKGEQSANRIAPAFRILHCDTFDAKNVTVFHAGGMGLIAENSNDLTLDAFNVKPSGTRMVSTTADATHFVGCRGHVILKNCTFNNQLDDASNIHGTYEEIVDILDPYTLGIRIGHFQQQNFKIGKAGDRIGIIRLSNSFDAYETNTIQSVTPINGRYHLVKFSKKLSENLQVGDLLENLDAYPSLTVQNCTISNNRARGLLISTPKKSLIENNFFSTEMEAILIPVESGSWFESGSGANITITNNTFQDCQHSGFDRGVIRFVTEDDTEHVAFKNIVIDNNKFQHFDNLILEVSNTDNLEFKSNVITNSGTFTQKYPNNEVIRVVHSKNIMIKDNQYKGKAKEFVKSDGSIPNQTNK